MRKLNISFLDHNIHKVDSWDKKIVSPAYYMVLKREFYVLIAIIIACALSINSVARFTSVGSTVNKCHCKTVLVIFASFPRFLNSVLQFFSLRI